ncbi:eight transmembrane protein EpsH [Rippkaea orientalis PCC 8801]|uniref:Eight transmembrane protein EpsH n=1 Tax=Rippkaea orientalis (strain PCC 8801 / RF-1) TaxID=41431 RepID=B7K3X9_RIPO1|nr:cyanoexosortase B [Rippkaea orientalis]ACK66519.1 eight transmembrane protein EpsH [Rippkaea orientalis PCC 8801]
MQAVEKLPSFIERNLGNCLIAVLLGIIYGPILIHWYDGWLNKSISIEHEYFSHGILGLPYAAYIIFHENRQKWRQLDNKSHPLGGFLLLIGIAFYINGSIELANLSFPIILGGIFLWLKGMPGLKLNGFPLLLIFLATPNSIPYLLTPYTLPLQTFIANVAGFILMQLGLDVRVDQIYLAVNDRFVEVAPYCAGLKMMFTSLYVSLLLLHWSGNLTNRKRIITLLSGAVIISIAANIVRNTLLSLFHGYGNDKAFASLHEGTGGDLYSVLMLVIIVALNWSLDKMEIQQKELIELEGENPDE